MIAESHPPRQGLSGPLRTSPVSRLLFDVEFEEASNTALVLEVRVLPAEAPVPIIHQRSPQLLTAHIDILVRSPFTQWRVEKRIRVSDF